MKRRGRTEPQPWEPFREAYFDQAGIDRMTAAGMEPGSYRVARNNRYQVVVTQQQISSPDNRKRSVIHLSIKRLDKKIVRDWRHLQRIKNEILGPEVEAVEIFPAESRLVDAANQYHLWCFPDDPSALAALGFQERLVEDGSGTTEPGEHRQRPHDEEGAER